MLKYADLCLYSIRTNISKAQYVENVDTIVLTQLDSVQSDTIKKQILVDIYTGLTT